MFFSCQIVSLFDVSDLLVFNLALSYQMGDGQVTSNTTMPPKKITHYLLSSGFLITYLNLSNVSTISSILTPSLVFSRMLAAYSPFVK